VLLITVELLPGGSEKGRRTLGEARIINVGGDAAYGHYLIELREGYDEPKWLGQLSDYPRFAGSVWDLAARGIIVAMAGSEWLPPRPVHAWRQDES
jgi:hypothetical protein